MKHEGLHVKRLHPDAGNSLEQAYAELWLKENTHRTGRSAPLLAYLLDGNFSQRDATVAATVIQWLGSHVGRSFVNRALCESGEK
jgi:hypothetical protein